MAIKVEQLQNDAVFQPDDEVWVEHRGTGIQRPVLGYYITYINEMRTVVLTVDRRD